MKNKFNTIQNEILSVLRDKVIPFWLERGIDRVHGGYLTDFDQNGEEGVNTVKYIVTQSRMLWGFSRLAMQSMEYMGLVWSTFLIAEFLSVVIASIFIC